MKQRAEWRQFCSVLGLFLTIVVLADVRLCRADEIAFDLRVLSKDDTVTVQALATGKDPAQDVSVEVELDGTTYRRPPVAVVPAKDLRRFVFQVRLPKEAGSYPLITRLYYTNDGKQLSVVNVGYFNFQRDAFIDTELNFPEIKLRETTSFFVSHDPAYRLRLVLPREIEVTKVAPDTGGTYFRIRNTRPEFSLDYAVYVVLESPEGDTPHRSLIVNSRLRAVRTVKGTSLFSTTMLGLFGLAGFVGSFALYAGGSVRAEEATLLRRAVIRWGFSIGVVSTLLFVFRTAYVIPDAYLGDIQRQDFSTSRFGTFLFTAASSLLSVLYFDGNNYDNFALYVADPLLIYILTLNLPVLFFLIRPSPAHDKYWHLMRTAFSTVSLGRVGGDATKRFFWSPLTKIALLTLLVKLFYVPMLSSWAIGDV
ncbi:MAG: hypothetical protein KDD44_01900, partial [Bdellovibrionales bacterium]|nr:hypothetical protein [Bdellovibrionales bacterium]